METKFFIVTSRDDDDPRRLIRLITDDPDEARDEAIEWTRGIERRVLRQRGEERPATVFEIEVAGRTAQELAMNTAMFVWQWPSTICSAHGDYAVAEELQEPVDALWEKRRARKRVG